MFEEYTVLLDKGNSEATHLVQGLSDAKFMAVLAYEKGEALYSAVIDKDGNRVAEYGGQSYGEH